MLKSLTETKKSIVFIHNLGIPSQSLKSPLDHFLTYIPYYDTNAMQMVVTQHYLGNNDTYLFQYMLNTDFF